MSINHSTPSIYQTKRARNRLCSCFIYYSIKKSYICLRTPAPCFLVFNSLFEILIKSGFQQFPFSALLYWLSWLLSLIFTKQILKYLDHLDQITKFCLLDIEIRVLNPISLWISKLGNLVNGLLCNFTKLLPPSPVTCPDNSRPLINAPLKQTATEILFLKNGLQQECISSRMVFHGLASPQTSAKIWQLSRNLETGTFWQGCMFLNGGVGSTFLYASTISSAGGQFGHSIGWQTRWLANSRLLG